MIIQKHMHMIQSSVSTRGVTLIELMVTVAVIAIISAVALPAFQGYIIEGRSGECRNEVGAIRLAEEEFFINNNTYTGGNINAETASMTLVDPGALLGLYTPSTVATTAGQTSCTYTVVAGLCGNLNACYTINATGVNSLAGRGIIVSVNGP